MNVHDPDTILELRTFHNHGTPRATLAAPLRAQRVAQNKSEDYAPSQAPGNTLFRVTPLGETAGFGGWLTTCTRLVQDWIMPVYQQSGRTCLITDTVHTVLLHARVGRALRLGCGGF